MAVSIRSNCHVRSRNYDTSPLLLPTLIVPVERDSEQQQPGAGDQDSGIAIHERNFVMRDVQKLE